MMRFRRETNLLDAPREIIVFVDICPHYIGVWGPICGIGDFGGKKIAPSPIIAGLKAILNLHTLRCYCCAEQSFLYLALGEIAEDLHACWQRLSE